MPGPIVCIIPQTIRLFLLLADAVGLSRVGKTEVGKTIAYMHHDTCVRIVLGQQDSRWGMSYRGTNFVLFDEGFKLNVSSEVMKQRIDGGKQQETIPNKGMVDIHVNSMTWLNCNDGDDNTHKLFQNIEDRNGALNNRLPSFEYRYEKEAEDSELTSKIQVNVALNYGAEVPFIRPNNLSQDDTIDLPVFKHCLNYLKEDKKKQ